MNERVIVVGAGGISNAWFPPIVAEQLNVVAVVDVRREAAAGQIAKYQIADAVASDDLDATLRDHKADFLIDLTIPEAHHDVTLKALAADLHVIGEKPMADTMERARAMRDAALRADRVYMVDQSRRWDANHVAIAAAVLAGAIGEPTIVDCDFYIGAHFGGFRDQMDAPLILDMAIHHFDLVRMFTGKDAVSVQCESFNPRNSWYRGDAACVCTFELAGGVRFTYRGSWCADGVQTSWNGEWRLIGTEGSIRYIDDQPPTGTVVDRALPPAFVLATKPLLLPVKPLEKSGFAGALNEMLRYLRTGERPQTEAVDNIQSLAMVHASLASARGGRRVPVEA